MYNLNLSIWVLELVYCVVGELCMFIYEIVMNVGNFYVGLI